MSKWRETAKQITEQQGVPVTTLEVFLHVLEHIADEGWRGACHSSSTVLYMMFAECGVESEIVIGDVEAPAGVFEHSWIEIDGAIYDAAVAFPDLRGEPVGGPVFAGIDLDTGKPTINRYGVGTFEGLSPDTQAITWLSIRTYYTFADNRAIVESQIEGGLPPEPLWHRATRIAHSMGSSKTSEELASAHFEVRRTVRTI